MKAFYTILLTLIFTRTYAQDSISKSEAQLKLIEQDGKFKIVPFNIIERVPVYSGCDEQLSNEKLKKCMSDKISSFVLKTFDTRMASYLKPSVTDVRITVLFKIDEHGNIGNIMARGPHPKLEQEAIRVVEALPDMTKPGMQDGKPAIVPYMLPIRFAIEKPSKNQRIQN